MKIHHFKRCPLSKSNIFYQNFMKLGHIVKYRDVFTTLYSYILDAQGQLTL